MLIILQQINKKKQNKNKFKNQEIYERETIA